MFEASLGYQDPNSTRKKTKTNTTPNKENSKRRTKTVGSKKNVYLKIMEGIGTSVMSSIPGTFVRDMCTGVWA